MILSTSRAFHTWAASLEEAQHLEAGVHQVDAALQEAEDEGGHPATLLLLLPARTAGLAGSELLAGLLSRLAKVAISAINKIEASS